MATSGSSNGQSTKQSKITKASQFSAAFLLVVVSALFVDEGKRNDRYVDIAGIPTICFGHTGKLASLQRATDDQCREMLEEDVRIAVNSVFRCIHIPLEQHEVAALTRWTFNLGQGNLCSSTMAKMANAGQPAEKWCRQMINWTFIKKGGKSVDCKNPENKCSGIYKRRISEMNMCLGGVE